MCAIHVFTMRVNSINKLIARKPLRYTRINIIFLSLLVGQPIGQKIKMQKPTIVAEEEKLKWVSIFIKKLFCCTI